ncbi:hypothetical protein LBMAG53_17210 [Planctomycetota bacterium]|nr:hypothetical protein LBMAG53_17210 [Planctomycetota bacterium]
MSFPRYPAYKDSGVEWLGEVPEHWEVKPLRRLVEKTNAGEVIDRTYWGGSKELLYTCALQPLDCDYEGFPDWKRTTLNDLLLTRNGTPYVHKPVYNAIYTNVVQRITLLPGEDRNFIAIALGCSSENLRGYGVSIESLNYDMWKGLPIAIPPLPEQTRIAAFLDRETAKIDGLVAEQQRLIDLIKEKRQAVISHAVTKGLNPAAPMKPSGIEWLGDVPAHWEIRKVSHLFRAGKGKNGQMLTKEYCAANEGDFPVYSGQTENDGVMGTWNQFEFDFEGAGVLFSTTVGSGKVMTLKHLYGKFSLSQNCMVIWPTSDVCLTRFYFYHFQPLFDVERSLIPQHMQASFRMEDLYSYIIAVPPVDEQHAIAGFIDLRTRDFDALTAEAQRAIDLLHERRTALISAAVTGQIDVRHLAEAGAA